ncbi:hypothetical protein Moror_4171 [Moniliophthora roreri MCA 2997]|uniref:DUF6534 domain-containing protein n=2 Tax=Moniliophthora roreri TaxID=221103 RepID=V2XDW1_MONRO|nr:hypothetical protein Moror_4171 [Moniliophthora roreri MCA 2997]
MPNILSVQAATSPSSTGSSSFALGVDLSAQYDALYYGFVVTSILFGITIVQVWVYILSNNDPWPLRLLVAILFLGDLSTTILINNLIHDLLIVHFGDLLQFTVVPSVVVAELIVTGLIVCTMELFFASRIYMLGRVHRIVPICIVVFSVLALILTLVGAVGQFKDHSFAHFASRPIMIEYGIASSLSTLADILASGALSWSLKDSRTGFKQTDTLLQRLFQYFVARGLLVAAVHLCFTTMFLIDPLNLNWVPFHLSLSKLYAITIISLLNTRSMRTEPEEHRMVVTSGSGSQVIARRYPVEGITVSTSTTVLGDDVIDPKMFTR